MYIDTSSFNKPFYGLFYGEKYKPAFYQLNGDFVAFSNKYILTQTIDECLLEARKLGFVELDTSLSTYFILPNNKSLANIRRSASSTFTSTIAKTFYPDIKPTMFGTKEQYGTKIPYSSSPIGTPYALLRHPIDRFISAYSKKLPGVPYQLPIDNFIEWLIKQDKSVINWHFKPQNIIIGNYPNVQYFDFKTGSNDLAKELGLPTPLPHINKTETSEKSVLTSEQIKKLENYYAGDLELYTKCFT